jgi:hypothetical protein
VRLAETKFTVAVREFLLLFLLEAVRAI